jgi:DNA-binding response OmpR family regulator
VLTALVVDHDPGARRRVAGLLQLAGWEVHQAPGPVDAIRRAADLDLDLVVTDARMFGGTGPELLRRLRAEGSRARFLVVAADPTDDDRAEAAAAGALATLAKPVDADVLLNFLRNRAPRPAAQGTPIEIHELDDLQDSDLDVELMDRLQEMYVSALPERLSAIASGARSGDAPTVASAAYTLAGTSGQLGHPDVASVCQEIAHDARRGVLAHARLARLQEVARG